MALCSNLALVTVTAIVTLEVVGPAVPGHSTVAVKVVEAAGTAAVEVVALPVVVGTAGCPQVPG